MTYHWDSDCPGIAGDHIPCTCGDKASEVVLVQEPPTYSPAANIPAAVCRRCGALVVLTDEHSAWHVSLTAAIQHLANGVVWLFSTHPGGKELIAEVEAEQQFNDRVESKQPKGKRENA